jgi:putative SOS response-associated peptidase YedK
VKDPKTFPLLINARGESVIDKPAFRAAMHCRRCLFLVDGFYEWQKQGTRKRPYFIRQPSGAPFAFAGVWENWVGPHGEVLESAAIVTTRANQTLAPIHDRMPVIVQADAFELGLNCDTEDPTAASSLLAPPRDDLLEAYEVSAAVNRPANDHPGLIVAVQPQQELADDAT